MSGTMDPFDPEALRRAALFQGLTNLGATLVEAGTARPGRASPGLLGGLGMGGAALTQGYQQGLLSQYQNAQVQDRMQQDAAWRRRLQAMPEDRRGLYAALGPQQGAAKLLEDDRRQALGGILGGIFGGGGVPAPGSVPFPAAAPAAPTAAPSRPLTTAPELTPILERASAESGVPVPVLAAVLQQESSGGTNPAATANGGGPMQIIRSTAAQPGYGMDPLPEADRTNPERAIPWAARYFATRARAAGVTNFSDPQQLAIALRQYNGGGDPNYVTNVQRFLPQGASPTAAAPAPQQGGGFQVTPDQIARLSALSVQFPELAPMVTALAPLARQENQITTANGFVLRNGMPVMQLPAQETPVPGLARYRELLNRQNLTPAEERELKTLEARLGERQTVVNPDNVWNKLDAESVFKTVEGIQARGRAALNTMLRLNQFERDLARVTTGAGSGVGITFGQLAQRFGLPDSVAAATGFGRDQVAAAENIRSGAMQMLQQSISDGSFPSNNFSNTDRDAILQANVSLLNSNAGNAVILRIQRAMAERDAEIARAWTEWTGRNGRSTESAQRFLETRLPEIQNRDVLEPILKDFRGAPAQPVGPAQGGMPPAAQMEVPLSNGMTASPPPAPQGAPTRLRFMDGRIQ